MTIEYRCAASGPIEPGAIEEVVELVGFPDDAEPTMGDIAGTFLRSHFSRDPEAWKGILRISVTVQMPGLLWLVTLEPMTVVDFDVQEIRDITRHDTRGILLMDNERALLGFVEVQCDDEAAGQVGFPDSDEAAALRLVGIAGFPCMAFWQTPEGTLVPIIPQPGVADPDYAGFCVVPRHAAMAVFPKEQIP